MQKLFVSTLWILFILGGCADEVITPPADALEAPRITLEELKSKLDQKADVIVVDVRGDISFEQEHIKGAISIPLGEVEARHEEFPKDKEIVFY